MQIDIGCYSPPRLHPQKHVPITLVGIPYFSLIYLGHNNYQSGVVGKTDQFILQNEKKLRGVQEDGDFQLFLRVTIFRALATILDINTSSLPLF